MEKINIIRKGCKGVTIYGKLIHKNLTLNTIENKEFLIPEGQYLTKLYFSPSFKRQVILLVNVKDRSYIEIHPANYAKQLRGCIAVGLDIDKYGEVMLYKSTLALDLLLKLTNGVTILTVTNDYN